LTQHDATQSQFEIEKYERCEELRKKRDSECKEKERQMSVRKEK
jgi:hypothetical protein